ncbi:MAG TPA: M56 family metallopeptidase [Pseudolabrys sp.]|nr:M56 family metallopeptidase [Pseudolabrys sp.]
MLALLLESALRSLLLGAAVWLGLKFLRVKNPHAQMTAWTLVLVASMAMPALMRLVTVTIPDAPPAPLAQIIWPAPAAPSGFEHGLDAAPPPAAARMPQADQVMAPAIVPPTGHAVDWRAAATAIYVLVTGMLVLRLLIGLVLTWRLARAARPVRASWASGIDVRVSDVIGVPVTFGSTILLPTEYVAWNTAKRRAVLTHERAHVAHADFYVLLLAALNRAVFWFNPLAWWQFVRLAELAEIISDDAALEALEDRPRYAGILLDVARRRKHVPVALAMARPATVRRRVERILAARDAPARTNWRQRTVVTGALLPLVVACAVSIAHGTAPVQPELPAAQLPGDSDLDRYVGAYQVNPWRVFTVTRDADGLSVQYTGQPKSRLARGSEAEFDYQALRARISFAIDGEQPATALILHRGQGSDSRAERIDAARARVIEARFQNSLSSSPTRFRDQAPVPGSKEALLQLLHGLQQGAPDYSRMNPLLAETVRPRVANLQAILTAFGSVKTAFFRGVGPGGYDIYGVMFANGVAEMRLALAADGMIEDFLFRPNGDDTPGDVLACAQETALRPAPGGAPIRVSMFNETGGTIQLFELDRAGTRAPRTSIEDNRGGDVLTRVGSPVVVADAAGQCLEIVMPGAQTRFHQLLAGQGPHRLPARFAPLPGSEETLLHYIDNLGRGTPDYARMTPDVAAATQRNLALDRAILAQLGPVRSISFRGVGWSGVDIYTVHFANGSADWRLGLVRDGRIGRLGLGPQY